MLKKVFRISNGNYGALGKRRSRSSFKAEIAGSNPARPAWILFLDVMGLWPNWEGNGLLNREMRVRPPPGPSRSLTSAPIAQSGRAAR